MTNHRHVKSLFKFKWKFDVAMMRPIVTTVKVLKLNLNFEIACIRVMT